MPFQSRIIEDDEHKEILLAGAFGSAKTRTLCGRAVWKVQRPGSRICITRATHTSLLATTIRTLLEPDGDLPAVLPPGAYIYKEMKGRIHVHGGGEIVCAGCDNPERLGSEQFSDVMLDEGIETKLKQYLMLLGRLRVKYPMPDGSENKRTITTATNPGDPSHYLYERFYIEKKDNRLCVESNTSQNYYLPEDYKQSLDEFQGVFRSRYFLGMWVAFEGAIYPMFDKAVHVVHNSGPWTHYIGGVDVGMNHPNVIRVHGCVKGSPRSHVVAEFHKSAVVSPVFVKHCQAAAELYSPMTFVIDSAAADVAQQMREAGLSVVLAEKDVLPGIRGVQNDLAGTEYGGPLLTFEPTCEEGNAEYPLYMWMDGKEEPVKKKDDALDADRYARMYIRKGFGGQRGLVILGRRRGQEEKPPLWKSAHEKYDPETDKLIVVPPELNIDDERLWGHEGEVGERAMLRGVQ